MIGAMDCPTCGHGMRDVTDSWETFAEAKGAEYLASYVTIWSCRACHTVAGSADQEIEWVLQPQEVGPEE
jgi:hypothetical protein